MLVLLIFKYHARYQRAKNVDILIGRYSDYFGIGNDIVEFFQENKELVQDVEKIEDELKSKWERLNIINCCIHLSSEQKRFSLFYLILSPSLLPFLRKINIGFLKLISDYLKITEIIGNDLEFFLGLWRCSRSRLNFLYCRHEVLLIDFSPFHCFF